MNDMKKYYENTQSILPHSNVEEFINLKTKQGKAIDIGCGAGRDTIFLIKNGWEVISIDREDTSEMIFDKLNDEESKKLQFIQQNFENIKLEKSDLLVANFSIPFCNKKLFKHFWQELTNSISKGRIFCRKFFWK